MPNSRQDQNLDKKLGFWVTIALIFPFMICVEIYTRLYDWKHERPR